MPKARKAMQAINTRTQQGQHKMASYDLFNGDADDICALIQLRLAEPKESTLVTGIKRDNKLLKK